MVIDVDNKHRNMELIGLDLKQRIKDLPEKPGIYLMKDKIGNIIYIGKSKSLRNRVTSYFQQSKNHTPKIKELVGNIHSLDYIETDTELEALLLESKLIKEKKPMYNRLLKNTKRYIFIKITLKDKFPRVIITHEDEDDGGLYFGPFTSLRAIEQSILFIKNNFPIIQCNNPNLSLKGNACLNYHLGRCSGICEGLLSHNRYMNYIGDIMALLNGERKDLVSQVEKKMDEASSKLDFKLAATHRDQIASIKHVLRIQKIINNSKGNTNILALESIDGTKVKVFFIKGNILVNVELLQLGVLQNKNVVTKLKQLCARNFSKIDYSEYADINRKNIDEVLIISSYLKNKKKNVHYINLCHDFSNKKDSNNIDDRLSILASSFLSLKVVK